jgi:hypothetical protein
LTLSSEAGRPVYVSTSGIDPSSGAVSPAESRMSDQFGAVGMRVSDLRGYGGQFTANVSSLNMWPIFMSVGYNLQWVRREYRGFDGAAFGDPRVREWAPDADDARHVIVLSGGWASEKLGTLTFFSRLQSGLPFTPIVQGDVNGDGRVDDRAFIPNPMTTDARLSSQLQSLLANGVPSARHCLNAYLGRVAPLNGCRGPWTQSLNLQWSPNIAALQVHHIQSNIYFQNVLAGLDQALHNDHSLRGWGGQATPDPVLLIPRGFDPTTQQFAYDVNPRFGDTRSGRSFSLNPFQIMIDFRVDLSTDYDVQQLRRAVEPERGPHGWQQRSAASITTSYLATTSDIYKMAIVQSDSLFLTAKQIAALEQADSAYSQHVRDLYVPLGKFLVERESRTGQAELDSVKVTQKLYWKIFWEQVDIAATIITPVQREYFDLLKSLLQIPAANREYTTIRFGDPVTLAP